MIYNQSSRNGAMKPINPDKPQGFDEVAPRGPLEVKNLVVGILRENGDHGVVIPDPSFKETNFGLVDIAKNNLNGAPFNMVVTAEILNPSAPDKRYRGKIVEVLGDIGNNDVRMTALMRQFGLSGSFPDKVLKEVKDLPVNPADETIEEEIKNGRRDLRDLLTITMDGEEAKDLDDAISLEMTEDGNYRLFVHIADVSHYVRENSNLDKEAFLRGTSVYLVDRVIPMLPPKLSNGLCSLNPGVPRLALTAEMVVDKNGKTIEGDVYESVIQSDKRTSYNECFAVLFKPDKKNSEEFGPYISLLWNMKHLTDILKKARSERGALQFNLPETKVILDDDGNPTDVMPYPINYCHGMIEEFMICANEFIAEKFNKLKYPFVYRVHEDPDRIKISGFCSVAKSYGALGTIRGRITPKAISDYMSTVTNESLLPSLETILLRSLAKARYCPDNLGHFGLASEYYCHFTSPIRRYPDLFIHRVIKSYLHKENHKRHFGTVSDKVSEHASEMERNSVEAERQSVDIKTTMYMHERLGEHFVGKISSVISAGVFVELENSCEGFVPFRTMRDHYVFDERALRAVGVRGGSILMIGQEVKVVVAAADLDTNKVDFIFEEDYSAQKNRSEAVASKPIRREKTNKKVARRKLKATSRKRRSNVHRRRY